MSSSTTTAITTVPGLDEMPFAGENFIQWRPKRKTQDDLVETRKRFRTLNGQQTHLNTAQQPELQQQSIVQHTNNNTLMSVADLLPNSQIMSNNHSGPMDEEMAMMSSSELIHSNSSSAREYNQHGSRSEQERRSDRSSVVQPNLVTFVDQNQNRVLTRPDDLSFEQQQQELQQHSSQQQVPSPLSDPAAHVQFLVSIALTLHF